MRLKFFLLVFPLFLLNCKDSNDFYKNQMIRYLTKYHNFDINLIERKQNILLINLECIACLGEENILNLNELSTNTDFIFVGKAKNQYIDKTISDLVKNNKAKLDKEKNINKYELNFVKVLLITIEKSKITQYKVLPGLNIEIIKNELTKPKR